MKKITLLVLFFVGLSTISFAQRGEGKKRDPAKMAQKKTEKMKEDLNLSDDQFQKLLVLNQEQATSREAKKGQTKEMLKANREEMKKARKAYESSLKEILNTEQYEKHKANLEEKKANRQSRPAPSSGRK